MPNSASPNYDSFDNCLTGLQQRSESAADAIWKRFAPKLRRRVDDRLTAGARLASDADDVLQSAFRSFFYRFDENRFQLTSWFALWRLLVTITDRKCLKQNRRSSAAKRTANAAADAGQRMDVDDLPIESHGPADNAILVETLARLFENLAPCDRDIVWMYLQGVPARDIARKMCLSQRSIQRCISRARKWLERQSHL